MDRYIAEDVKPELWDFKTLNQALMRLFGGNWHLEKEDKAEVVVEKVRTEVKKLYDLKKEELKEHFIPLLQMILLGTLDARWKRAFRKCGSS